MARQIQQILQLESKMQAFKVLLQTEQPSLGWIKSIRLAIGMSLQQLGKKLDITKQSVLAIETREMEGAITIKALREAAKALDMELVYGFVPMDGSLEMMIERKARELATSVVLPTTEALKLADPKNFTERINKAINEGTEIIKQEMPKVLWD